MCRVPNVLHKKNIDAYSPGSVSIGPLHRGRNHLQEMEAVKVAYMNQLVQRNGTSVATLRDCKLIGEKTLRDCMEAMLEMQPRVRESYACINHLDLDSFSLAEMMVIDGCFIIELLYKNCIDIPDQILRNHLKCRQVKHDLLLLENQIPFFVLQELFRLTVKEKNGGRVSLHRCILSFFGDMMGLEDIGEIGNREDIYSFHILHVLHIYYLPDLNFLDAWRYNDAEYQHSRQSRLKYSATELNLAGVKFLPHNGGDHDLFDLKFSTDRLSLWNKGRFKIPCFSVNESTELLLRNLIALEHCYPHIGSHFSSHAVLMSILLNSSEDVKLLEKAGVIRNNLVSRHSDLDSNEAVSQLFKDVSRNTIVENQFLYSELCRKVTSFCSPWRLAFGDVVVRMQVIAVLILNLLTLLSSVYTVLSYYYRN